MSFVSVVEVSPRDGLQNEPVHLTVTQKVRLISDLVTAGSTRIEAVAFASPRRVPAMAGAEEVMQAVPRDPRVSYSGLVLNRRGLDRALECGVDEVNIVVCASDTLSERNQGVDTTGALDAARAIVADARAAGLRSTVTVAAAFGCPFEGEIPVARVTMLSDAAAEAGADELCLADSIGVGVPSQVHALVGGVDGVWPVDRLRFHLHNTRNTGYANAMAAVEDGVLTLDASAGGIGGCPFAPGATGNIATEDLLYALHRSGHRTGIDLDQVCEVAEWLGERLDRPTPGLLPRAGGFPASR